MARRAADVLHSRAAMAYSQTPQGPEASGKDVLEHRLAVGGVAGVPHPQDLVTGSMSTNEATLSLSPLVVGRYALFHRLASGGMASVHIGRSLGAVGFSRTVAIKRLHPHIASDADLCASLIDEARLAGRIRHANVVAPLDVVTDGDELLLVMEYIEGAALSTLLRRAIALGEPTPAPIAVAIAAGALRGLHAAHEARDEQGEPLHMVHRDVSPQNILLGVDGTARVTDFGIAKGRGRLAGETKEGIIKGKLAYMAPEQIEGKPLDHRADIYAASVVLWETLVSKKLFSGESEMDTVQQILSPSIPPPSQLRHGLPPGLDEAILRGLHRDPSLRWAAAEDMARAIEIATPPASPGEVARWVADLLGPQLVEQRAKLAAVERWSPGPPQPALPAPPAPAAPAPAPQAHSPQVRPPPAPLAGTPTPPWLLPSILGSLALLGGLMLLLFGWSRPPSAAPHSVAPDPHASMARAEASAPPATPSVISLPIAANPASEPPASVVPASAPPTAGPPSGPPAPRPGPLPSASPRKGAPSARPAQGIPGVDQGRY
jgi:serine/threonine protein kinase